MPKEISERLTSEPEFLQAKQLVVFSCERAKASEQPIPANGRCDHASLEQFN
jgi:hypothetical protein